MSRKASCATLALLFTIFTSGCNDPHPSAAVDLMSAFGSACVTTGSWSQQALAHSQAITTVLQNIRDSDPCKPFQATLGTIQSASQQVQALLKDQTYTNYRVAEEQVQDLTLALQNSSQDKDLSQALQNALVQAQVNLAQDQGANQVDQSVQGKNAYVNATGNLATFVQQMLQQSAGLSQCLKQSPSVAVELATNLMAMGGSFISPVYGAGAAVIGQLINFGVEYARENQLNDAIQKMDEIQMPHSLGCAMEAMSELYCDAVDSETLLGLAPLGQIDAPVPEFWQGMDLLTKRMPIFDNWLLLIRNGVLPQDSQDADRQNEVWHKIDILDRTYRTVYGLLAERKRTYDGSSADPQNQQNLLVHAILDASYEVLYAGGGGPGNGQNGPSPSNPFGELTFDIDTITCWLALDPKLTPPGTADAPGACPAHNPQNGDTGESYVRAHLVSGTSFTKLFANWDTLRDKVKAVLDVEFAQNITADPTTILGDAKKPSVDNLRPYDVLQRLQEFTQAQLVGPQGQDPNERVLLNEVLNVVTDAIHMIDDQKDPIDRVKKLFDDFDLDHGLQKIDTNVNQIVQWDLNARVKAHQFPADLNEILLTSGMDVSDRLAAAGLKDHGDALNKDLTDAQEITTGNLDVFRDFFSPSIASAVQYLSDNAASHGEPAEGADRPFGQALGHLCTMVLQSGMKWPQGVSWDICSKAVYDSIFPDTNHTLTIRVGDLATQLQGKDYRYRICSFHRFLRASRYAEVYSQGTPSSPPGPKEPGFLGFFIQ